MFDEYKEIVDVVPAGVEQVKDVFRVKGFIHTQGISGASQEIKYRIMVHSHLFVVAIDVLPRTNPMRVTVLRVNVGVDPVRERYDVFAPELLMGRKIARNKMPPLSFAAVPVKVKMELL